LTFKQEKDGEGEEEEEEEEAEEEESPNEVSAENIHFTYLL
jgi:hypothetical protein